eukprot:2798074-Pyramimonas_sp.AAC.1
MSAHLLPRRFDRRQSTETPWRHRWPDRLGRRICVEEVADRGDQLFWASLSPKRAPPYRHGRGRAHQRLHSHEHSSLVAF